ncbi:hypothetical protein [Streptomyces litchfieldiae]|uniref:Lipoprotein n=1 Tax=Streptomyces litchfieldiae TaxID=3075543 RepID=A0ABU2MNL2_9ACTN|nr:hypothetical protein [Streptomyces sp. DSM 44938]MDT0342928.1 hypothetical protein [Streptomyces sp. DSM 44938]
MSQRIRPRLPRALTALTAAALLALMAAGCSDDSGDDGEESEESAPPEQSTRDQPPAADIDPEAAAALEESVRAYTEAFFAPDAETAYGLISERCQGAIELEAYAEQLDQAAADHGGLAVESFVVEQMEGELARVTYTVGVPEFDERLAGQPWRLQGDTWVFDAC